VGEMGAKASIRLKESCHYLQVAFPGRFARAAYAARKTSP